MLKSPLFWKMSTLLGCILLLSIPLMIVRQLIDERADYRSDVIEALESSTSGAQKLAGPLIAIPVTETLTRVEGKKTVEYQNQWVHYWLPETLAVNGNQDVESRRVGIYEGQIWHNNLSIKAHFDPARITALRKSTITLGRPFLVVSVSDARGIGEIKAPEVNGETLSVEPGPGTGESGEGIHMPMPLLLPEQKALDIEFTLNLNGSGSFSVVMPGAINADVDAR